MKLKPTQLKEEESRNKGQERPMEDDFSRRCFSAIPARYVLALLGFFGFCNMYAVRVTLSVALVAMVGTTTKTNSQSETACLELVPILTNQTTQVEKPPFKWDSYAQSQILSSFFYGYVITQIPGGILAERFGGKWIFGIGVLATSVCAILTPFAARIGIVALIMARVVAGLAEGVTFPAMNAMFGIWVPKMERSRISTLVFMGCPVGTVMSMALSGYLASSDLLGGWPSSFYVFGTLGCIWFFFWIFLIHDNPEDHPRISESEVRYIQENQAGRTHAKIPWLDILTSPKVWALYITHFGQNWGNYTMLTELPTYLSNILHYNIKQNGVLSSLPYIMQAVFAVFSSIAADKMRHKSRFTITTIRKLINSVAFYGPAVCILLVAFVGCRPTIIMTLLCISLGLNGFMFSGFKVTHVDMSPEFSGTLMGITNCIANISGFLAPIAVGQIIKSGQTLHNWGLVFGITSAVYFFTGTIYNLFCSAELQPWGTSEQSDTIKPSIVDSVRERVSISPITNSLPSKDK